MSSIAITQFRWSWLGWVWVCWIEKLECEFVGSLASEKREKQRETERKKYILKNKKRIFK